MECKPENINKENTSRRIGALGSAFPPAFPLSPFPVVSNFDFRISDFKPRISEFKFGIWDLGFEISNFGISRSRPRRSRGFSFAEVMFAVIILGIGFIMIAALFPVAISQSKSNTDETNAAAFARAAAGVFEGIATDDTMRETLTGAGGTSDVWALPLRGNNTTDSTFTRRLWELVRGNIISTDDPRYAWVPFYFRGRDLTSQKLPYAKLIMICVQSTQSPTFSQDDVSPPGAAIGDWCNLRGRPVRVKIANGDDNVGNPDLIGFEATNLPAPAGSNFVSAVAEGCFVIIRSDIAYGGRLTGKIYRVGAKSTVNTEVDSVCYALGTGSPLPKLKVDFSSSASVWELIPGSDFQYSPIDPSSGMSTDIRGVETATEAWIVGRSFADPKYAGPTPTFEGPAMDVSAFSTVIYLKP